MLQSRISSKCKFLKSWKFVSTLPLNGVKVVDLSRVLAGPYGTMNLADIGADVVKVERCGLGDETRHWGPPFVSENLSDYFVCCNRNKRSIALDYSKASGREIIHKLVKSADVFVENLRPGTLEKYNLDYKTLSAINPKLVYASLTGYGQTGPYSKKSAYDLTISAEGGLMSITGPEDGDPVRVGVAITDICSGLYLYSSILAALFQAQKCGVGQHIDVPMLSVQLSVLANIGSSYLNSGIIAKPMGSCHPSIVPYQGFNTCDGFIVVAASNDGQFKDLCEAIGWPSLPSNPMFCTNDMRVENRGQLIGHLSERFSEEPSSFWVKLAENYSSFSVSVVNNVEDAFKHPQAQFFNVSKTVRHEKENIDIHMAGHPVRFRNEDTGEYRPPPFLGENTNEILSELGYSSSEIEHFHADNVVG